MVTVELTLDVQHFCTHQQTSRIETCKKGCKPDKSGIQMVGSSLVAKWSIIQMTSEYQTKSPDFEW